jgi:hypothetical protein
MQPPEMAVIAVPGSPGVEAPALEPTSRGVAIAVEVSLLTVTESMPQFNSSPVTKINSR